MKDNLKESSQEMTFFEHLDALRPHLLRAAIALVTVMIVAFTAKEFIFSTVLMGPQSADFPTNRLLCYLARVLNVDALCINQMSFNVVNTTMAGQFNLHLKISLITAIVIVIPYMLWELWQFVKPALTPGERRGSNMFVIAVSVCFFVGLAFGYYIIAPLTINFLSQYSVSETITNMIDISSYLSTVVNVSLACAAVFQLPVLVYFLARMGILTAAFMRKYRRHAIVVLAIISAVITPPDIFSMILVVLPMYALYEYSIPLAAKVERKKARLQQKEALEQ